MRTYLRVSCVPAQCLPVLINYCRCRLLCYVVCRLSSVLSRIDRKDPKNAASRVLQPSRDCISCYRDHADVHGNPHDSTYPGGR